MQIWEGGACIHAPNCRRRNEMDMYREYVSAYIEWLLAVSSCRENYFSVYSIWVDADVLWGNA